MSFLYPYFLFASAAILVPVIIHFFNFRSYKTIYFSNIRFLKLIKAETKSKSRLRHLLILLARVLTILALVFAFAKPYIPLSKSSAKEDKPQAISVYIDNSFSMNAESEWGNLLEVAKNKARGIAEAYPNNMMYMLITNDFESRHQHLAGKEKFLEMVGQVKISPKSRKISEVILRNESFIQAAVTEEKKVFGQNASLLYIISDFQKVTSDFDLMKSFEKQKVRLIPLSRPKTNNLFIDSCWFETKGRKLGQNEELFVKIQNKSDERFTKIPLKLSLNDTLKSLGNFDIEPNSSLVAKLSFTNLSRGNVRGKVEIQDYPILFDNQFFFNYLINDSISILSVSDKGESPYLAALYRDDNYLKLKQIALNSLKNGETKNHPVLVLDQLNTFSTGNVEEFSQFVENGGTLAIIPGTKIDIPAYNSFLKQLEISLINGVDTQKTIINKVELKNELYKDAFRKIEEDDEMPFVFRQYSFAQSFSASNLVLLATQKGKPFLVFTAKGNGRVFMFSSPFAPEWTSFARNPLFVPTLYNIPLLSGADEAIAHFIGKDETVALTVQSVTDNEVFHVRDNSGNFDFIPQILPGANGRILVNMQQNIRDAGQYVVSRNEQIVSMLSFNFDRMESNLETWGLSEIKENIEKNKLSGFSLIDAKPDNMTAMLKQMNQGKPLWKWFIICSLVFLLCEVAIIRFWKI
jgi:hypothetical protein